MTEKTRTAYNRIQEAIDTEGDNLQGADWYDLLEEISSHVESMMDCYREENPQDFE